MMNWLDHLIIAPILLPLLASAATLLLDERRRKTKATISLATLSALLVVAFVLLDAVTNAEQQGARVYRLGNWAAPFGIVLVADRLSTMMLALAALLGLFSFAYALSRWSQAGPRFHPLFMLMLMGINGAFLTGDLFNLFVFFEVLLAGSYGLALHGGGRARVTAGLHYVVINLTASSLFLVGASLIYATTGTLNMADVASRVAGIVGADRMLFEIGCAVLGIAFVIKAALWPLGFWLPAAYASASAPVAAMFGVLTKVGVYVILRLSLLFGHDAGHTTGLFETWLLVGGLATLSFGTAGVLSSHSLPRIGGYCVFISSGTLIAAIGSGARAALAGALFYLVSSTIAVAVFFLLAELLERTRAAATLAPNPVFRDEYRDPFESESADEEVGVVLPAAVALIGWGYMSCVVLLAGLPPLSSFIGKFAIMSGLLERQAHVAASSWIFIAALTCSSLATLIALARAGIETLWVPRDSGPPLVRASEFASISALLAACLLMTLEGGRIMRYMDDTARWLHAPRGYIQAVFASPLSDALERRDSP